MRGRLRGNGQRLARERLAPKDPPPIFNQVQPGGADRNEGVLDARMRRQWYAGGGEPACRAVHESSRSLPPHRSWRGRRGGLTVTRVAWQAQAKGTPTARSPQNRLRIADQP
jgi:hypothetical protein